MIFMKFIKAQYKALHMIWGNPKHEYRLRREWVENSSDKDLHMLVDEKLNVDWQRTLPA